MGGAVEVTRFQKGASLHEMISIQYSVGIYLLPRNWKDNQMAELKIGIVVGSTREGRFADKPANWIRDLAQQRPELDVELVDLRDYPMPFFEDATSPAYGPSPNKLVQAWQAKVASLDGYIFTAAEYNHGPTAVLKNALDYAFKEWNNKPAAFVGYGGVGGTRAVEQLRLHAVELEMAPIRNAVHIQIGRASCRERV